MQQQVQIAARGSNTLTSGIRVIVRPFYWADRSDPTARAYVFRYRVLISNEGNAPAQLLSRHWQIKDAHGTESTVDGPGVLGEFPSLNAGQSFTYESYCPIGTHWGTMEGYYTLVRPDGSKFNANIARFYLVSKDPEVPTEEVVEMNA